MIAYKLPLVRDWQTWNFFDRSPRHNREFLCAPRTRDGSRLFWRNARRPETRSLSPLLSQSGRTGPESRVWAPLPSPASCLYPKHPDRKYSSLSKCCPYAQSQLRPLFLWAYL